jgi:hypothetical protein
MKLRLVTATGADDSTQATDLIRISNDYPFVEWGLLISKSSAGNQRFPSNKWLESELPCILPANVSGHICGQWVRDLCEGKDNFFKEFEFIDFFNRFQLNFHSLRDECDVKKLETVLNKFEGKQIVFQLDGKHDYIYKALAPFHPNIIPLHDVSGGNGISPEKWNEPIGDFTGYAGGISPANIRLVLSDLLKIVGNHNIWIDAESKLRSDDNQIFDIRKVRHYLHWCKFVIDDSDVYYYS